MPDQRIVYCYEMYSASERMSVSVGTVEFGAAGDGTKLTYTEQALAGQDLVEEYRLNVFPFVAGTGRTLFAEIAKPAELELVSSTAFDGGQIALVYRRARGH